MQSAQPSSQEHDASASTSVSASDADRKTQPGKEPIKPQRLFREASLANSLPGYIEALEAARRPAQRYSQSSPYSTVIIMALTFSIKRGQTSLAAYLLDNEPLAPAIMREHIGPGQVSQIL